MQIEIPHKSCMASTTACEHQRYYVLLVLLFVNIPLCMNLAGEKVLQTRGHQSGGGALQKKGGQTTWPPGDQPSIFDFPYLTNACITWGGATLRGCTTQ